MMRFLRRSFAIGVVMLALACGPGVDPGGADESSSGGTSSSGSMTTIGLTADGGRTADGTTAGVDGTTGSANVSTGLADAGPASSSGAPVVDGTTAVITATTEPGGTSHGASSTGSPPPDTTGPGPATTGPEPNTSSGLVEGSTSDGGDFSTTSGGTSGGGTSGGATSDTGPVTPCGNGDIDPGEQCDGDNLQGFDCLSLGLGGGRLGCDPITCTFDTSMCRPSGGTGFAQPPS